MKNCHLCPLTDVPAFYSAVIGYNSGVCGRDCATVRVKRAPLHPAYASNIRYSATVTLLYLLYSVASTVAPCICAPNIRY